MKRTLTVAAVLAMTVGLLPASVAMADGACGDPYTPIYEIQGDGDQSPLVGETVTTEGVVTVDLQEPDEYFGFFLQALDGDGNPATSDGIFVNLSVFDQDVEAGDHIRITGIVFEEFGQTQLGEFPDTPIIDASCGSAVVTPLNIKPRQFNSDPERYEGMYLRYTGNYFVTDTFNLHRFGEVWVAEDGVVEQPTNEFEAGTSEMLAFAEDNIAQSVMIDGSGGSNPEPVPFLTKAGTLRLGDMTNNPTGAIQFGFGNYRMVNSDNADFKAKNRRLAAPKVKGDVTVASFNVLNYWTTLGGRGAFNNEQLDAQTDKLVAAIRGMDADIVGLQEIENDHPDDVPIITLVDALNAAEGSDVWSRIDGFEQNVYPIVNEIIYRNDRVTPTGDAMTLIDPAFDEFRFPPSTDPDNQLGRRPVAQAFEVNGEAFTVMVNHFKSKSTTGATGDDLPQGDGQSGHNARRVLQAEAVLDWLPTIIDQTGDPDVLVIGDFNAYLEEDPIHELEKGLENLVDEYVKDPYSFNFFAGFAAPFIGRGALDFAFATESLADQVRSVAYWHINADEPRFLDWFDPDRLAPGPYRSSDHDPVLIGLDLKRSDRPGKGIGR